MFDLIERLSKKPENQKRVIAVLTSLGVTLIIFAVWLSVILPTSVHENVVANADESSTGSQIIGPLGAFKRDMATAFSALKEQLGSLKDMIKIPPSVYTAPLAPAPENNATNSENSQ